ncbi:hypothetical protein RUM44_002870 [Polyplax serrata]|uniref:Kinesin motor domain-containing protein n=1 Tax=Polyplax serrata TaxID=468196 RepID=A0ABR1AWX4_POLSC
MGSVKVTVYGRVKPCPKKERCKDVRIRHGENDDYITFTLTKPVPTKKRYSVMSGYNGTIFTYGQTGSGKTYTMTGDIEQWVYPGLIPRTIQKIFQMKESNVAVSVTYCEIYNEHVYDLIRTDRPNQSDTHINIMEESSGATHFRNLSVHNVTSAYEAIQLLLRGDANKMVAETASNPNSSRSHVLFSITLDVPHPDKEKMYLKPVLYLVDLAGSEKMNKINKNPMSNPWETRYINLSLHYLEQVLLALRQPGRVHVPYRNSLMTALLRNSLGGNCVTAMIATFCLTESDLEETIQTCKFAERIALIRNDVKITQVFNPSKEIEELRKENRKLRSQIKLMSSPWTSSELSQEEKDECAEVVHTFIENKTIECIPFMDTKRIEYCFCLLRDEIIKNPKKEVQNEQTQDSCSDLFSILCKENASFGFESKKMPVYKPQKTWIRKKCKMSIPKINIKYNAWTAEKEQPSDKEENVPTKRPVPRRTAVPKSQNLVPAESTAAPETEQPEENESCTQLLDKAPDENSSCKEDSTENVLPGGTGLSSVEEIEITEQRMDCSCNQVGTTSSSTAQPEVRDYEKCTGENLIVEKIKELISIGVQIDEEIQIESEEEFDLEEIQERMSVVSEGGSSYLSWNHLPLTGDVEVDEEIIKFYKERYKIFKEKEMT